MIYIVILKKFINFNEYNDVFAIANILYYRTRTIEYTL
jgi:hypothetical protein